MNVKGAGTGGFQDVMLYQECALNVRVLTGIDQENQPNNIAVLIYYINLRFLQTSRIIYINCFCVGKLINSFESRFTCMACALHAAKGQMNLSAYCA